MALRSFPHRKGEQQIASSRPVNGSSTIQTIGAVEVDYAALTISGPDGTTSLEPKVMAVLQSLAAQAPSVVSRQALIELVWGSESAGDESLSRAISLLRKALGDRRGQHDYIETIPRRGYRLVAPVGDVATANDHMQTEARARRHWRLVAGGGLLLCVALTLAVMIPGNSEAPAEVKSPDRSIAVLPFSDLSPSGDQEYFADGLAEEILNALTQVPELQVAGRTSTFAYKGRNIDIRRLGSELGVSHVLEGSVRKEGDDLRITAQLIRADNGYRSWSRSFDGSVERVFDFQEEIARDIARALEVSLDPEGSQRLAPALTPNQAAYDAFLQGRSLARRFGPEAKLRAAELLSRAVQLDPEFALAWAELGRTELFIPVSHPARDSEPHLGRAREAVGHALDIDPGLAMGHYVQGLIQEYELDYAQARESFKTAYELDSRNPFLTIRYGNSLATIGHTEVGIELMEQGLRLDPTDAAGIGNLGIAYLALGDLEQGERALRRSYQLGFAPIGIALVQALQMQGRQAAAREIWRELRLKLPGRFLSKFDTPEGWETLGRAMENDHAEARQRVVAAFADYFSQPAAPANTYRLWVLVQAGQPAEAMRLLLERNYPINAGFVSSIWFETDEWKALRQHEDFPAFAERIGLVDAWRSYGWPSQCRSTPQLNEGDPAFQCR